MRIRPELLLVFGACAIIAPLTAEAQTSWRFTVTSDMRGQHAAFDVLCQQVNTKVGGPGEFHVSVGDIDGRAWENRAVIDTNFGAGLKWYPIIGNHEEEDGVEIEWLRAEYDNGNGVRTPLSDPSMTNADGPVGTQRVNYTWDYGNAHFIALNEYWNGNPTEGTGQDITKDDTATDGDVVSELRAWLEADLQANQKPFVFVFGHEPAFPYHRHVGDSLDGHLANRDAFWQVLEDYDVAAYLCGHTHYYSKHQGDKDHLGDVWQLDAGNAGNDPGDGKTFFNVIVYDDRAEVEVWRDNQTDDYTLYETVTLLPATIIPEPITLALLGVCCVVSRIRRQGLERR